MSRKRNGNAAAGGEKRSKRGQGVSMMDVLPEELVEMIVRFSVRGHLDVGMLKAVCSDFNRALYCDDVWKLMVGRFWGSRADIIAPPIKRTNDQTWERSVVVYDLVCADVSSSVFKDTMLTYRAPCSYFKKHQFITPAQRSILMNWVLAVVDDSEKKGFSMLERLGAQQRTVAYFDRYCRTRMRPLVTSELQLLGAACAVLALQMKDPVQIDDSFYKWVVYYADGAITDGMLMNTVKIIYQALSVDGPGGLDTDTFKIIHYGDDACFTMLMRLLQKVNKGTEESSTFHMTFYLAELGLQVGLMCLMVVYLPCNLVRCVFEVCGRCDCSRRICAWKSQSRLAQGVLGSSFG